MLAYYCLMDTGRRHENLGWGKKDFFFSGMTANNMGMKYHISLYLPIPNGGEVDGSGACLLLQWVVL